MRIICSRCKAKMQNHEFDFHECKGMRNLHEMKSEFLLRIIKKEITEEQAWKLNDEEQLEVINVVSNESGTLTFVKPPKVINAFITE